MLREMASTAEGGASLETEVAACGAADAGSSLVECLVQLERESAAGARAPRNHEPSLDSVPQYDCGECSGEMAGSLCFAV